MFDLLADVAEASAGAVEAALGADDADVVPHAGADFVPVVFDDDGFIGGDGDAFFPGGDGNIGIFGGVVLDHVEGGLVSADGGFEEGVAGEPVGAMETGAGDFSGDIEVVEGCVAVYVGGDAAAGVVGGGDDGNAVGGHVDAVAETGGVEVGEAFA